MHSQPHEYYDTISAIVVDDDRGIVSVLSDFLQIKGVKVIGKEYDGLGAVEIYKKLRSDVIFLDVLMERYDGFYAFEKIKEFHPEANIVMMTADSTSNMQEKLETIDACSIIYKPYDINEIVHVLNKISTIKVVVQ